jgi:tetratricopeptide (TPR) repeat protein
MDRLFTSLQFIKSAIPRVVRLNIFVSGISLFLIVKGFGQTQREVQSISEAKKLIQQGINLASEGDFEQAENILSPFTSVGDHQTLTEYYMGYIDYQRGVVIYRANEEMAKTYLDSAIEHLENAIRKDDTFAEAHALLSSCYGIEISFSSLKAIWLGPKSGSQMGKARGLAPENPRVALLGAIGTYNTPGLFGGGKEKGLGELKKADSLFAQWKITDSLQPDWGKEQVQAWIGLAYLDQKDTVLARKAFEKALEINPDYGWVRRVLMPRVASNTGSK